MKGQGEAPGTCEKISSRFITCVRLETIVTKKQMKNRDMIEIWTDVSSDEV